MVRSTSARQLSRVLVSAVTLFAGSTAFADLVVNQNLGTVSGTVPFSGTTVGGANNASGYSNANPLVLWTNEFVYSFTTTTAGTISLTSNDPASGTLDNDFFLLNSLATTPNSAGNPSATTVHTNFVDQAGSFGVQPAGTYYLSVDSFFGSPTTGTTKAGAFAGSLLTPGGTVTAPASIAATIGGSLGGTLSAGQVVFYRFTLGTAQAVSFDTYGSTLAASNDTELFLYDSTGTLLGTDDDDGTAAGGGELLSVLESGDELPALLASGTYYLGIGGFNTVDSGAPFGLSSTSTNTGAFRINGLSVPEPTSLALLSLGGLAVLRRRRA